jgi:hypothetical protein
MAKFRSSLSHDYDHRKRLQPKLLTDQRFHSVVLNVEDASVIDVINFGSGIKGQRWAREIERWLRGDDKPGEFFWLRTYALDDDDTGPARLMGGKIVYFFTEQHTAALFKLFWG